MNKGCCTNCQSKEKTMKKEKKLKEESHEEKDVKQKQKVEEDKKNPKKADSDLDNESDKEDEKDEKEKKKDILTWQHESKKKEKPQQFNNNNSFTNGGYNRPPSSFARPMMYHGGSGFGGRGFGGAFGGRSGLNPSNWWPTTPYPRGGGRYPPFTVPPPMCGPYGGGGGYGYGPGPYQPYQSMPRGPMYNGACISPYPPMSGAFPYHHPPPYWQPRPYSDANPMTRYTSYADNYSYGFI